MEEQELIIKEKLTSLVVELRELIDKAAKYDLVNHQWFLDIEDAINEQSVRY